MTKKNRLYTVGYEGLDIETFVNFLAKKKIKLLADVRKNPVSRKKGFSKHKLAAALAEKKIAYRHFAQLGVPTEWRKRAKEHLITREKMFDDYTDRILPNAKDEMGEIAALAAKQNTVVLCYEADASDCHRSYMIKKLNKSRRPAFEVINLSIAPDKSWR